MTSPCALILCSPALCSECIKWHVSILLFKAILRVQHSCYIVHKMHKLFTYHKLFTFSCICFVTGRWSYWPCLGH